MRPSQSDGHDEECSDNSHIELPQAPTGWFDGLIVGIFVGIADGLGVGTTVDVTLLTTS